MIYELPTSATVCGTDYKIRSDFRAVLDICTALEDPELDNQDKAVVALSIFYPAFEAGEMPREHLQEALQACFQFIDRGEEAPTSHKKLMSWEQDFQYIIAPVNRVIGKEIRELPYLHWWTFLSAYYEIGDCLFARIVHIRDQKARGKTLDKVDREFYQKNRSIIDLKTTYTEREDALMNAWLNG